MNGTIGGDFIPPPAPTNAAPRRNPRRSNAPTTPEESAAPPAEDEGQTDPTDDAPSDGDGNNSDYNPDDDPPSDNEEESGSPVETGATPNVNNPQQQSQADENEGEGGETPSTDQPPPDSDTNDEEENAESTDDELPPNNYVHVLDPDSVQDLLGQEEHEADRRLKEVYGGDTVHRNDGRHLHGGVDGDAAMCMLFDEIVSYPHPMYSPPKGKVGQRFLTMLAEEWRKVRGRETNSERALIFPAVIMRRDGGIRKAKDIRRRLTSRMNLWESGKIAELVQDTVTTAKRGVGGAKPPDDEESIARKYNSMVNNGKVRAAVRSLTSRDGGGVLDFEGNDTKTGRVVMDVLRDKHPEMAIPDVGKDGWASFEAYEEVPASIPVDCSQEIVAEVASKLSGGAGPGSVDGLMMKNWLLRHGKASQILREELAAWTEWLCNERPPWAAYRGLMSCRLVALDKCPGVRPLGIGDIWRRGIAKCALKVCGEDAKAACGSTQLCAGLEAGIEGAMHAVKAAAESNDSMEFGEWEVDDAIWEMEAEDGEVQEDLPTRRARLATEDGTEDGPDDGNSMEEGNAEELDDEDILLLVDADNGFNNLARMSMLWTVRHLCCKLSTFTFNCYRHEVRLVCRRPGQVALILLSREGVTQGDPMAMAVYGIALIPLADRLRKESPNVLQPWYADDAAMQGPPAEVVDCFALLCKIGPMFGYFPAPAKSFYICPLATVAKAKAAFSAAGMDSVKDCRGHRYVGGFAGSMAMRDRWIEPKVAGWVEGIKALSKVAVRYPQAAYFGFCASLQSEWQYLSRVVQGVEVHLQPVEDAIRKFFIPALLCIQPSEVTDQFRRILTHGVKMGGLNIRDPCACAARLYQSSSEASAVLVQSLIEHGTLDSVGHKQCVRKAGADARKERMLEEKEFLDEMKASAPKAVKRRLERFGNTGAWLTATPNALDGTLLSAHEFVDNVRIRYGLKPVGLCERCDGCGERFTVEHGLSCKKGGLVSIRHDDARDEAANLCAMALTNSRVSCEPLIFYGKDVNASQETGAEAGVAAGNVSNEAGDEARGDIAAHGLIKRGETCIMDIRVTDTDAKCYQSSSSEKCLERAAKSKKDKYLQPCIERRRSFIPLVYSVDGMACKEARAWEKRIASLLANKHDRQYSEMVGFVRSRMSLAIIRSNTMLLRGARQGRAFRPELDDSAAFDALSRSRGW